ncbi:phage portal protein family protein [Acinetobacter ursingii]|uniref:phage portal protein family protein n=1 Tax=Acinetobacter ursingii TaxID=108980 RepID=UPI00300A1E46
MAKKDKSKNKDNPQQAGGYLYSQQAEVAFLNFLTKMPDLDEVLRKAGVTRHRLSVLMYDDEIYQCVEKRQDKLESAPFKLEPSEGLPAQILTSELKKWWSELSLGAQDARWYGYSVLEAVYTKPELPSLFIEGPNITPFIGWQWIGKKPMQWFEPKNDGRLMLLQMYNNQHRDVECDQQFKHFLTQCKPSYENPYGEALFSRLYWLWFFKNGTTKFWAKFVERFGNPLLKGKSKNVEAMLKALLNAHASSVLSLNQDEDVDIITASSNGNGGSAAFESFDKKIERSIQKVVLGQTLTSGTDNSGSRALGEVHLEVQNNKVNADIRMITSTIQAIIDALCALNGWERHIITIGDEQSLNADKADRDVKLKNAGANLSSQYFKREYGLQDGDVAEPQQSPPAQQFKALPNRVFSFAADMKKLSAEQQDVEELTDAQKLRLLDQKQVNDLLQMSASPEDVAFNLVQLIPGATKTEFTANLERALFQADVMGYVYSQEGK